MNDTLSEIRKNAVRAICKQQASVSNHVCRCMEEDGLGFEKLPGALLCRDTYEEIWDALKPIIAQVICNTKSTPDSDFTFRVAKAIHDADKENDSLKELIDFDWVKDMRIQQARAAVAEIFLADS